MPRGGAAPALEVLVSRTPSFVLALAVAAAAASPLPASAHGVVAEVDRRDGAVAVRVRYHDGPPLADAAYEVRSPRGGDAPFAEGRTDRHGWVAFTPDVAGLWKVRIVDASGHGKVVDVKVESVASVAPAAPAPVAAPPPAPAIPAEDSTSLPRVLAGAAAIAAAFGVLFAVQRARRGKAP